MKTKQDIDVAISEYLYDLIQAVSPYVSHEHAEMLAKEYSDSIMLEVNNHFSEVINSFYEENEKLRKELEPFRRRSFFYRILN